ncbi:MAG: TonB-dependent receptor [Sphingomonadales bacterium]|nr:TonB-dependent receptor [Sphingomonadales bacterium]MDE2569194.1 TonB-dependent receptor [Sphingomonadales bacterium]
MGFVTIRARRTFGGISVSASALALAFATPAHAQSDASTVQGHVEGASAGTQVFATDTYTGQKLTGTVDANGNYAILGVRASTWKIEVPGQPPQTVTVLVGQTSYVDFGTSSKQIVVVGGHQIQQVHNSSIATNITPAQIENLPQNTRNFLSFAALAPGVQVTSPSGAQQVQSGATSASNTNVLLDGMSLKNPINHGGIFGQNFGVGNPFPQSAIQEYKVETQNFGAETGQTGSALITAITKTGGNEFHGSAFIEFQPKSFIEQPYFDKLNGAPKPEYNRKQFGGELGGPIIPGKLHFYAAFEGTSQAYPPATTLAAGVPQSVIDQINGTYSKNFHQGLYFGKLTWYAGNQDRVDLSAFVRRESNLADLGGNAAYSHGRLILTHQDRYQIHWQHTAGDFLNNFNAAYEIDTQSTPSISQGVEQVISSYGSPGSANAFLGGNSFEQYDHQKSVTIKDDATLRKGAHTIKFGGQAVFLDLSRTVNDHFTGSYFYMPSGPGLNATIDYNSPYQAVINLAPSPTLAAKDTQIGLYLADEWKPDDHWTVNAGLRWDLETNANNDHYVTPAAIVTALQNYPGWQAAGINPNDYISTGSNRHPEWGAIQPRLGFSYDVHGDRDFVIFGGIGRYFDRSLFIEGAIEQLTNANQVVTLQLPACAGATKPTYCTDPNALRAYGQGLGLTGGSVWLLNNKTPLPFTDQIDLGIRKRFGDIQTSLTFSYQRSHNIFQFVRANYFTNGWYTRFLQKDASGNVVGCTDGGNAWIQDYISNTTYANCPAGGGQLAGFSGKLDRGASSGVADYKAIFFQAEKPFTEHSRWGFNTALTIQFARTNDQQELNSDEFYNGTAQNVYGWGWVNGVEKWRWVTTGNWRAPYDIQLSGTLTLSSGPAFGNIQAPWNSSVVPPDGACCYAKMGGVFYPKPFIAYKRLDLRVAKTFKMPWGGGHELTFDFQAFNVFNWLNRTYSSWGAGGGSPAPLIENGQVGNDQRAFQAGIKYKF